MADSKITALDNLTSADPANDMIPIVDVSATPPASGNTKRISINNLLACSPSATLASATITGDLTVDTSTLKVDSTNNRVGIGTATPVTPFDIRSNGDSAALFLRTTDPAAAVASALIKTPVSTGFSSTVPVYGFWYQNSGMGNPAADTLNWIIASGEAMRLNATGLGVGGSASGLERFVIFSGASKMMSIDTNGTFFADGGAGKGRVTIENSSATNSILSTTTLFGSYNILKTAASQHQWFIGASTQAMTLDASGNLLVGTTSQPSGVTLSRATIKSTSADWSSVIWNSNATPYGFRIQYDTDSNATGNEFLYCLGAANLRASIRSNGGIANYQANDVSLSDSRMKSDIKPLGSYWNKIKSLEIVTFKYKDQTHNDDNIGLIAQQVESVAPEFVDVDGFGNTPEDGVPLKTIYTTDLYHAAIKALQEAMTRIEVLESKLA